MRVSSALVATYAEYVNGRVSIIGAFNAGINIPSNLPSTQWLGFVCECEFEEADLGNMLAVDLSLVSPSGVRTQIWHFAGAVAAAPGLPRGAPLRESLVCEAQVVFQMEGLHSFEFAGSGLSASIPFYVALVR